MLRHRTAVPSFLTMALATSLSSAQATLHVPSAFATIQSAIAAAVPGDVVVVAPGTYFENIDFLGKAIVVHAVGGATTTAIDGGQAASVVTFLSGEPPTAVLDGFMITNGRGLTEAGRSRGGGIHCVNSSPTIRRCMVIGNFGGDGVNSGFAASPGGDGGPGGLLANNSSLRLVDCELFLNVGGRGGLGFPNANHSIGGRGGAGGAYANTGAGGTPDFLRCKFAGNSGGAGGDSSGTSNATASGGQGGTGGVDLFVGNATVRFTGSSFDANTGGNGGSPIGGVTQNAGRGGNGGIDFAGPFALAIPNVLLLSCTIVNNTGGNPSASGNSAFAGHGGGSTGATRFTATSTTVASNRSGLPLAPGTAVGGLVTGGSQTAQTTLTNCIFWGNTRGGLPSDLDAGGIPATVNRCDIGAATGTILGANNIAVDPLFVSLATGDVHLTAGSPCRHAGGPATTLPLFDIDGDPRTVGPATDMGADEFDLLAGSRDDFALSVAVNGGFSAGIASSLVGTGDLVDIRMFSPAEGLVTAPVLFAAEAWVPPAAPVGPPVLPELQIAYPLNVLAVFGSGVGASGTTLSFVWPGGLTGIAIRVQAFALSPLAKNGVFAASAARDLFF